MKETRIFHSIINLPSFFLHFFPFQPARLCGLILRSQLIVLLKHKVTNRFVHRVTLWRQSRRNHSPTAPAGLCGVGQVTTHPQEAAAEGLQRRLPSLPSHPEHPRLPGRARVYDGPHWVHEPDAVHSTTGYTHTLEMYNSKKDADVWPVFITFTEIFILLFFFFFFFAGNIAASCVQTLQSSGTQTPGGSWWWKQCKCIGFLFVL